MDESEINFDGLVGPTHNYAGLSVGNLASMRNVNQPSNPKLAALEGLEKMRVLAALGVPQAVLPPQERPHLPTLRALGYSGTDAKIFDRVGSENPVLLAGVSSASSMWAANAATVSPSADTADRRVHFTPANLVTQFHRSIEPPTTRRVLCAIFSDEAHFKVHDPLPASTHFADEGAANHTRLVCDGESIELFTAGRRGFDASLNRTTFPARQTYEACEAVIRRHGVRDALIVSQNPVAIDAGAFHNDVVAVGHRHVLLVHELAWEDQSRVLLRLRERMPSLKVIEISDAALPLCDAVSSYLFNSQLVMGPSGGLHLLAPMESRESDAARVVCETLPRDIIAQVHHVDVRQSMKNGGGPACLRLRVTLNEPERRAMNSGVIFDERLYHLLKQWVERHYRDRLTTTDLRDPKLLEESCTALDELTGLLRIGSVYDFQRDAI